MKYNDRFIIIKRIDIRNNTTRSSTYNNSKIKKNNHYK